MQTADATGTTKLTLIPVTEINQLFEWFKICGVTKIADTLTECQRWNINNHRDVRKLKNICV